MQRMKSILEKKRIREGSVMEIATRPPFLVLLNGKASVFNYCCHNKKRKAKAFLF